MIEYILFGLVAGACIVLWYLFRAARIRNEIYEEAIQAYYENTALTLHMMRAIDDRQLFEKDDDVGSTFQMLVDTLNQLRPYIYEDDNAEEEN